MTSRDDSYWSVDLPGLSGAQAEDLVAHAAASLGIAGSAVHPRKWLTRHFDVATVESIVRGLSGEELEPDDQATITAVLEDLRTWLENAERPEEA